jgi:hypothetical protein
MRFLVTDIGKEDVLLGYPWLSTYEPKFSWRHATIDEGMLPIVLRSINPITSVTFTSGRAARLELICLAVDNLLGHAADLLCRAEDSFEKSRAYE